MTRLATHHDTATEKTASMAARALWGAVAGIGLAALLAGVPIVLTTAFGWPPALPTGYEINYWHLHEADLAWTLLGLAGWAVWAWMTAVVISQIVHALRWGLSSETLRDTASPARWLAGALIGAVAAAIPTTGASAAAPAVSTTTSLDTGETVGDLDQTAPRPLVWASPDTPTTSATTANETAVEPPADEATDEEATVHTVKRGENSWTLAEHYYGDGTQWQAIWTANQGAVQPDGRTYTDPGEIHPGWRLTIPALTDREEETDEDGFIHETVEDGEHLWGYAEQYLGDGTRYDEIADLNYGRVQTDGRTLTDPDHIVNGWDILIPADPTHNPEAPADEAPEPEPEHDPAEGDDGPVPDTPAPSTAEPTAPEATGEPTSPDTSRGRDAVPEAGDDASSSNPFDAVPFGIWLTGGTCLAAATIIALATRLRRRRSNVNLHDATLAKTNEPMTGRLSDLEAVIEAEHRKLTTPAGTEHDMETVPVAVSDDRAPVDLRHLTKTGIGLLGPGQHGVARAAIIAAATAGVHVRLTEAANLRLDLDADCLPKQVQLAATLPDATKIGSSGETVVVCADTEIDETTRPGLSDFLDADGHGAIILGEWAPATARVAGDGTVEETIGLTENLGMLHIADHDTAVVLLKGLRDDNRPAASEPDSTEEPTAKPAPEPSTGDETQEPGAIGVTADDAQDAPTPAAIDSDPSLSAPYLCLFGTPEVYVGDRPVVFKKGKRAKAFLAALALADGPLSRAELMNAVLPGYDDPVKARTNLNTIGSSLRANLQDATRTKSTVYRWDKTTDRYELEPGAFTTDRDAFDAAEQSAALATDPVEAAVHLEEAVRLYTGDLAPDLHSPRVEELRAQYRAAAARALRKLADHYAGNGDAARAEHYRARALALASDTP